MKNWFRKLFNQTAETKCGQGSAKAARRRKVRPAAEPLESRLASAVFAYSAASNPAIVDYTLLFSGANLEVVNTADQTQVLASQSLASTTSIQITGQDNVD